MRRSELEPQDTQAPRVLSILGLRLLVSRLPFFERGHDLPLACGWAEPARPPAGAGLERNTPVDFPSFAGVSLKSVQSDRPTLQYMTNAEIGLNRPHPLQPQ